MSAQRLANETRAVWQLCQAASLFHSAHSKKEQILKSHTEYGKNNEKLELRKEI